MSGHAQGAVDAALGLSVDAEAPAACARAALAAAPAPAASLWRCLCGWEGRLRDGRGGRRQAPQRGEARRAALKADTATYYHCSSCDYVRGRRTLPRPVPRYERRGRGRGRWLIPPSPPPLALPSWDRKALLGSERSGAKFIGILLLVSNNNLATEIHLLQELVEHFGQGLGAQVIFTEEILKNIIN